MLCSKMVEAEPPAQAPALEDAGPCFSRVNSNVAY